MAAQKGLFETWLNFGLQHGIDTSVEVFAGCSPTQQRCRRLLNIEPPRGPDRAEGRSRKWSAMVLEPVPQRRARSNPSRKVCRRHERCLHADRSTANGVPETSIVIKNSGDRYQETPVNLA